MIKIIILLDKEKNINGLKISGHAGYDEMGQDIVCAGVSALTYTLINALESLAGVHAKCEITEGYVSYILPKKIDSVVYEKSQLILKTIVLGYYNMMDSYKTYIEVLEEEV